MLFELEFMEAGNDLANVIDRVQNLFPVVIQPRSQSEKRIFFELNFGSAVTSRNKI